MSQKKLAEAVGVSLSTVVRWEKGLTRPFAYHRRKLAAFFDKTHQELGLVESQRALHTNETAFPLAASLPPFEGSLVGRENDLALLRQRLRVPAPVILIAGLPGVGKTALALALSSDPEVRSLFQDGVLWAHVGRPSALSATLATWGKELGLSGKQRTNGHGEKKGSRVREAIGERAVLMVLDDVWTETDAQAFMTCAGPRCGLIITTRFPRMLTSLHAQTYVLQELAEAHGLAMLGRFAPQVVTLEPRRTRELVRAVGGLPLALVAIGCFLHQQLSAFPQRLQEAMTQLAHVDVRLHLPLAAESTVDERSVASAIATSATRLNEATRLALSCLALFPAKPVTFSAEAALAIAGCDLKMLQTLQDGGLLEGGPGGRLQVHQMIADYGKASLPPSERQRAYERFLAFLLQALDVHAADRTWLPKESQMILFAVGLARDLEKHHDVFALVLACAPWMLEEGWLLIALDHLQYACDLARRVQANDVLPRLLLLLGHACLKTAQYPEAIASYQEGSRLARLGKDPASACTLLVAAAQASQLYGDYQQAESYLKDAWELTDISHLPDAPVALLWALQGVQDWSCGNYVQAEAACSRSISLFQRLPETQRAYGGLPLCFLAMIEGDRGHYEQAEALFQQALSSAEASSKDFHVFVLGQRGLMHACAHPSEQGRKELGAALLLARDRCAMASSITVFRAIAFGELACGNLSAAERVAQRAFQLTHHLGASNQQGEMLVLLARIALAREEIDQTSRYLAEAWPLVQRYGTVEEQALAQEVRGELALTRGEHTAALERFREMARLAPPEHRVLQALAGYHLARCMAASGQKRAARREGAKCLKALELLEHVRAPEVRAWLASLRPVWRRPLHAPRGVVIFRNRQEDSQVRKA